LERGRGAVVDVVEGAVAESRGLDCEGAVGLWIGVHVV
jgi:hypothetical protein